MKLSRLLPCSLSGILLTVALQLAGCAGAVQVPEFDEATAEQKRQEYEQMVKKERMNQ